MANKHACQVTYTATYPSPLLCIPKIPNNRQYIKYPMKVTVFEFYTISDGHKRIFTDEDSINDERYEKILCPLTVSYTNLFINGVLQPRLNYTVEKGRLILDTEDIPMKGVPIILQMIKI